MIIKAWIFGPDGLIIKKEFETYDEMDDFLKITGLELFKSMEMPRMIYSKL